MSRPYTNQAMTLAVASKNISKEISPADLDFHVFMTCGKKVSEEIVPAVYPKISVAFMVNSIVAVQESCNLLERGRMT